MAKKPSAPPVKTVKKEKPRLSPEEKAQARFNKLINDIEQAEAAQKDQQAQADRYHQLYQQKVLPLLRQYAAEKLLLIHQFDTIMAQYKFSKAQKRRYVQWVVETLLEVAPHSEEATTMLEQRRNELIDLLPPKQKERVERIKTKMDSGEESDSDFNWQDEDYAWEDDSFEDFDFSSHRQQASRPTIQPTATPDIDDLGPLYKDLAKKLHPDLEQDEAAKTHKHELMQQLTQARKNRDLFTMLRIKAGLKEETSTTSLPLEQLKRYNKMLEEKLRQLSVQFSRTLMGSMLQHGFAALNTRDAEKEVEKEVRDLKKTIKNIREDRSNLNTREHLEILLDELRWDDY